MKSLVRASLVALLVTGPIAALPAVARADHHEEAAGPAAPAAPAAGTPDRLTLKDGRVLEGRVTAEDDRAYALKQDGLLRVVLKEDVAGIERGTPPAEPEPAPAPPAPGATAPGATDAPDRPRRDRPRPAPAPPPLGDRAVGWAEACIARLGDADAAVRRSAAEALVALGPAVRPVLATAAERATDDRTRAALGRVIAMVDAAPPPRETDRDDGPAALRRLPQQLGLDADQTRAFAQAMRSYMEGVRPLVEDLRDGVLTFDEARTEAATLRTALRTTLAADLSAEQLDKLDATLDRLSRRLVKEKPAPPKADGKPKKRKKEKSGAPDSDDDGDGDSMQPRPGPSDAGTPGSEG